MSAFRTGMEACAQGRAPTENPHKDPGSAKRHAWSSGWHAALERGLRGTLKNNKRKTNEQRTRTKH